MTHVITPQPSLPAAAAPKAALTMRPYGPEAVPALLELTRTALGDSGAVRKTEAFWHWKHTANPFGPSYGLYAWDEAEQRAAALRVLLRWQFNRPGGPTRRALRAVDTATHPVYRRQGLFASLTQEALLQLTAGDDDFIFNTPNSRSLPGYLQWGWQVVARWPLFIKLLRPGAVVRQLIRRRPAPAAAPPAEPGFGPEILTWATFMERHGPALPALLSGWERQRRWVGLRTPRTPAYLQWRYGQHPHIRYGLYPLRTEGRLTGLAVLRPNVRYGLQEVVLTELFLAAPDLNLGRRLMAHLAQQLTADYVIAHFAAQTFERRLLARSGFWRVPRRGMTFTARPLTSGLDQLYQPVAWDLSLGDLELF
ncbi:MAG: GNAT family N-acetyltransferase [Anaerolineae bacterium]|nr:GNAT family N-acetyltransferase [Anaerolineae bacterium]